MSVIHYTFIVVAILATVSATSLLDSETGEVTFNFYSKCATQEGEVQVVGKDNCRPGGDGVGGFSWDQHYWNIFIEDTSLPHNVMFARPQDAPWQISNTPYNQHLQTIGYGEFGPVNTHAICLIAIRGVYAVEVEFVYDAKTGILVGDREYVGPALQEPEYFSVRLPVDVQIQDFPPFEASPVTETNPYGRSSHVDTTLYNEVISTTTGSAGFLAAFVNPQICAPDEVMPYYIHFGLPLKKEYILTGDLLKQMMFNESVGGGVGIAMNVEPGFNPLRQNVHSWMLSVGGGVGLAFSGSQSHMCGNNYGFNITCDSSQVMPPRYPNPAVNVPFVYTPKYVCNPVTQVLDRSTCTCSDV